MPCFLHTADWQIGRQFSQFPPEAAVPMAEARLDTVRTLGQLATERGADAVLVAGDVFDTQTVSDKTVRRLFSAMEAFQGPWVLLPGNHDAALAESVWTRALRLGVVPAHVHLALTPEVILLETAAMAVLPAPLTQRHTFHDLTQWFDTANTPSDMARIGLAHGCVQGLLAESIDSANPLAADRALTARLDYLALGDWHGTRAIDPRTWYSGTPETDRFRHNESGQALWVELPGPGLPARVTPLPTGRYRWHQHEATLHVPSDTDALVNWLAPMAQDDVIDLRLAGQLDLPGWQHLQNELARAEARVRCWRLDTDPLRLMPTVHDMATLKADGYLGEVLMQLQQEAAQGQALAQDALALLTRIVADGVTLPQAGEVPQEHTA